MRYTKTGKPLDKIDTSKIADMSKFFTNSKRKYFSGIRIQDTSNVVNMDKMFYGCENFNQDLKSWVLKIIKDDTLYDSPHNTTNPNT